MIHRLDTIDSTNNYAKDLALQGAPHGTFVIATEQTGGRGRMGRSFHSPPGKGLYLSVILRPKEDASQLMHLTCATAVSVCNAIEKTCGRRPGIKWTNDLVNGNQKLGGILTELGFQGSYLDYAILGIGINCSHTTTDFPQSIRQIATSLSLMAQKVITPADLESHLIPELQSMVQRVSSDKAQVLDQYRRDCITLGKDVSIVQENQVLHGTAIDIDNDGGLIVRFPDSTTKTFCFGEISVRGMYGYV